MPTPSTTSERAGHETPTRDGPLQARLAEVLPTLAAQRDRAAHLLEMSAERRAARCAQAGQSGSTVSKVLAELEAARTKVGNLEIALATSRRIGMAMGVVMSEFKVTEDQAFAALIKASQTRHKKVRDIAEDVLLTGTIQGSAEG